MKKATTTPALLKPKKPKDMLADFLKSLTPKDRAFYKKSREYIEYKRDKATTTPPYLPAKLKKQREKRKTGGSAG